MSIKIMSMVWEASNEMMSPTEKSILLRLADFAATDGTSIYPSWKRIENDTGFSRRCIAENLVKLQQKKVLIKVEEADHKNYRACVYRIDVSLLHSWKMLGIDEEVEPAATPSASAAPPPTAPGAPQSPYNNHYIKYDSQKNDEKRNSHIGELDPDQELTQEAIDIAEMYGLLPEMIKIQFDKFKDYNLRKGVALSNWHSSWSSWCKRAIQYKPELKFTPPPVTTTGKIYGKFPIPKGFLQSYTGVEDPEGNRICMVYWDSADGVWAQSDGPVWEFKNKRWYKREA